MTTRPGILSDRAIGALFGADQLKSEVMLDHDQIQPASLDLRLGSKALRVRASFMPGPNHTVADKLERLTLHEIDLEQGAVLETGCVYIVPLMESLDLPAEISASAAEQSGGIGEVNGAVAQLERSMIRERSIAGQIAARARGRMPGRIRALSSSDEAALVAEYAAGGITQAGLATKYGVSASVVKRAIHRAKPSA